MSSTIWKRVFDPYTQHLKPDVQHKIPPNGPRLCFLGDFFSCCPLMSLIFRSTWKGQTAGNAQKYWSSCTACSARCNHDAIATKHCREKANITMLHHVTQEQTHPHIDSYDVPRLLRHFVVLSQRHSDFGAWDAQGQWKVFLCNSAASEASARSLSLQATRCCRYCRYIDSSARFYH